MISGNKYMEKHFKRQVHDDINNDVKAGPMSFSPIDMLHHLHVTSGEHGHVKLLLPHGH